MAFQTITQIGLDKAVAASAGGFAVKITHIGAGTSGYNPLRSRQSLSNEVVRVPLAGGRDVSANQVHLTGIFDTGEFACRELGFYLEDGTLFSVVSHPTNTIFYKTALNKVVQAFDLSLDAVPMDSVTVDTTGDLNLFYATEMSQLATADLSSMLMHIQANQRLLDEEKLSADQQSGLEGLARLERQHYTALSNRLLAQEHGYSTLRLSANQRLLGAGATPDGWLVEPSMTLAKVFTVNTDVLWANRGVEEKALLTAMGLEGVRYINEAFDVWRMSWTTLPADPAFQYTLYQKVVGSGAVTVAAMTKLESGSISNYWAEGAQLGAWKNTGQHVAGSPLGYLHIHPMRASTAGSLLFALPAAVSGHVELDAKKWGQYPYIGNTQNA